MRTAKRHEKLKAATEGSKFSEEKLQNEEVRFLVLN